MFEILKWLNICVIPKYINDENTCSNSFYGSYFVAVKFELNLANFYEEDKIHNAL